MSKSHRCSSASATCRLEWRPSRLITGWLCLLAVLSPLGILVSGIPRVAAWPLAVLAVLVALRDAWAHHTAGLQVLVVSVEGPLRTRGESIERWRLRWRGPLAFITWLDDQGHRHALSFWPDTLNQAQRRELRLATPKDASVSPAAVMAT